MRYALLLILLAGCPGLKKHDVRNAPGLADIDTPPAGHAADNPTFYEEPADPGMNHMGVAPGFYFGPGKGRLDTDEMEGTTEIGAQLHVSFGEREESGGRDTFGYPTKGWGASLGWGVQVHTDLPTIAAPVYLEGTAHWYAASLSAGLAVYPTAGKVAGGRAEGVDVGGQVTLAGWPYMIRMRYMQDSGFELFGVLQIELPASITWSR